MLFTTSPQSEILLQFSCSQGQVADLERKTAPSLQATKHVKSRTASSF